MKRILILCALMAATPCHAIWIINPTTNNYYFTVAPNTNSLGNEYIIVNAQEQMRFPCYSIVDVGTGPTGSGATRGVQYFDGVDPEPVIVAGYGNNTLSPSNLRTDQCLLQISSASMFLQGLYSGVLFGIVMGAIWLVKRGLNPAGSLSVD